MCIATRTRFDSSVLRQCPPTRPCKRKTPVGKVLPLQAWRARSPEVSPWNRDSQVGGKMRGRVTVARNAIEAVVVDAARAEPNIAKFLEGKSVQKVIYVPNRLLNLVLG